MIKLKENGVNFGSHCYQMSFIYIRLLGESKWYSELRCFMKSFSQFCILNDKLDVNTCLLNEFGAEVFKLNVSYLEILHPD